ncbi:MAG TPA: beta-ketoacyl-[acyl-carrier-protein] synthase family protein [Pirellulales bacterium]
MSSAKSSRRVVITGMGVISPLGNTPQSLWGALVEGRSGVARLPEDFPAVLARYGAQARDFTGDIDGFGPLEGEKKKAIRKGLKVMCRESQMGVAAAQRAINDAGLSPTNHDPERTGVVYGSDYMLTMPDEFTASIRECIVDADGFQFSRWAGPGMEKMPPLWLLKYLPNMPASHIAIYNDMRGHSNSITHREAAANLAIAEAFRVITRNHADCMVAGATGSRVHPMKAVHALQQEQLADQDCEPAAACRPFDRDRSGMVLGEGSGAVILEEREHALARGARIYGEIAGAGSSSVADRNLVARRDAALANAMRSALSDAGAAPQTVGHIQAHGLGTRTCDADEARAIREVFGSYAQQLPVSAAKSYFGNLGAGSGMVELIAGTLALGEQRLFRVLNYQTPDPECPIAAVCSSDTPAGDSFLNLNVTPQGQASCVMVRRGS